MSGLPPGVRYTPTPDVLYDRWLPHLRDAELVVILYLVRRTFGHGCRNVELSITQICKGFPGQDEGTGLVRSAAHEAVAKLVAREAVMERPGKHANSPKRYAVNLKWEPVSVPANSTYRQTVRTAKQYALDGNGDENEEHTGKQYVPPNGTQSVPAKLTLLNTIGETEEKTDTPHPTDGPQGGKRRREKPVGDRPETLEACIAWFVEQGYSKEDAEEFWYGKEANNWAQGAAAQPIKKWTAAAHYWVRQRRRWQSDGGGGRASPTSTKGREPATIPLTPSMTAPKKW